MNRTRDGKGRIPLLFGGAGGAEALPQVHEVTREIPSLPAGRQGPELCIFISNKQKIPLREFFVLYKFFY